MTLSPRIFTLLGALLIFPVISIALLLPTASTLDLNAVTDRARLDLVSDIGFEETTMVFSDALVCGEPLPVEETPISTPDDMCQPAHRVQLYAAFNGHIELAGPYQVTAQRSRDKELEILISPTDIESSITFFDASRLEQKARGSFIKIRRKFFDDGNVFTLVAQVKRAIIGGTGVSSGNTRGFLLTSGTATPLALSLFDAEVLRGTPIPLSMGDILEFNAAQHGPANVLLRVQTIDGIRVAARLPIVELLVRNFAGQGVPISMSWWDRAKAEPLLLLSWALLGLVVTILDWKGKFLRLRSFAHKETDT